MRTPCDNRQQASVGCYEVQWQYCGIIVTSIEVPVSVSICSMLGVKSDGVRMSVSV